jgi:hypothetical protein
MNNKLVERINSQKNLKNQSLSIFMKYYPKVTRVLAHDCP